MKYQELVQQALNLIASYNEDRLTPDSHSQIFLEKLGTKISQNERQFLAEVFYGTYRYRDFMRVFTDKLLQMKPSTTNRKDRNLYNIFIYLICFKLDQIPLNELKKIILSVQPVKLNGLFQVLFDIEKLQADFKPALTATLDQSFIDQKIINKIYQKLTFLTDIIAKVSQKATGKKSQLLKSIEQMTGTKLQIEKDNKKEPTKSQPFKLTVPKAKLIPQPIKINHQVKAVPVSKAIYKTSLQEMNRAAEQRRRESKQAANKRLKEQVKQFNLKTKQRPNNLQKLKKQVQQQRAKQFVKKQPTRPLPEFSDVDIKLNAAAILREEERLKKKIQEEENKLKDFQINMRDQAAFLKWQEKMKRKDKQEFLEWQMKKKIEMQLSKQAAIKALEDKTKENKKLADHMKEQAKHLIRQKQIKQIKQLQQKKKIVQQIGQQQEKINLEKQRLIEKNKKLKQQQLEDRRRIMEAKKLEDQIQNQKRKQLIRQIRQFQKQPRQRHRPYDPTQTIGAGLLQEMTLVQLRARLQEAKFKKKQQQQQRRNKNLKQKMEYEAKLQQKRQFVLSMRQKNSKAKMQERQTSKQVKNLKQQQQQKKRIQSQKQFQLKDKQRRRLKKLEQEKFNLELREIQKKRQFLNANQAIVQANNWKSLEQGAQRQIKDRQEQKLINQEKIQSIKHKQNLIRIDHAKKQITGKIDFEIDYDNRVDEANKVSKIIDLEERESIAKKYAEVRQFQLEHSKNMALRNSFAQKVNESSFSKKKIAEINDPPEQLFK